MINNIQQNMISKVENKAKFLNILFLHLFKLGLNVYQLFLIEIQIGQPAYECSMITKICTKKGTKCKANHNPVTGHLDYRQMIC